MSELASALCGERRNVVRRVPWRSRSVFCAVDLAFADREGLDARICFIAREGVGRRALDSRESSPMCSGRLHPCRPRRSPASRSTTGSGCPSSVSVSSRFRVTRPSRQSPARARNGLPSLRHRRLLPERGSGAVSDAKTVTSPVFASRPRDLRVFPRSVLRRASRPIGASSPQASRAVRQRSARRLWPGGWLPRRVRLGCA